ncbi:hypothetical protein FPSE_06612 [Fusarium pseudograminearum CS3096]|uniref:Uncharacterized protein n=1 Tax=Fusarium pseudograminearum (strain CS3096) TaxID=1028729 RepID=K3VJ05_FUSPC|nr:hypothetical protein FPSE_06612 [Fusarium pseudograminearum CS3096]EKJ73188.1 hypothetical protein FPSE_06612 [Fusarium pseudograminearum CS3096]
MAQILETLAPEAEEPLFPIDETIELIWPTMFSGQAILWTCQLIKNINHMLMSIKPPELPA